MSALPVYRPQIETRPQLRVVKGTRPAVGVQVLRGMVAFSLITLFVFGASSLAGHVMVEKARRDSIRANQRLNAAVGAQATLAKQIEVLSNTDDLKRWAHQSGFVAPDVLATTSLKNSAKSNG